MKTANYLALIIGALSLIFGIISKFTGPILNVSSYGFMQFLFACLLASIALSLFESAKSKQG